MSTLCPNDPLKTIFEAETNVVPNLDLLPRLGCMSVRPAKGQDASLVLSFFLALDTIDVNRPDAVAAHASVKAESPTRKRKGAE